MNLTPFLDSGSRIKYVMSFARMTFDAEHLSQTRVSAILLSYPDR
jgi:hypothetical protein